MGRTLSYEAAVALLPNWEWVRVLLFQPNTYPVEYNWPYVKVLEALQNAAKNPSWIEVAEPGAQDRGFGIRVDLPGNAFDRAYFETRERVHGWEP